MYQELIEYFSSRKNLANAWDVSRSVVSKWLTTYSIPAQRLIEIEIITNGKFKAKDLYEYQQSQAQSAGKNKYRLPTDEEIEKAIAKYSRVGDAHQHPDCVKMAFAFLDAQTKTKTVCKNPADLKHLVEGWCGRYVSASDVEIAAKLHPEIYGGYPNYNISKALVFPCYQRLNGLTEPFTHGYTPNMPHYARIECPEQEHNWPSGGAPKEFIRGEV